MDKAIEDLGKLVNDEAAMDACAKAAFEKVDKDKSGQIDCSELEAVMKDTSKDLKIDPPKPEDIKKFLDMLDTDKSGKLELNEFSKFFKLLLKGIYEALKEQKK